MRQLIELLSDGTPIQIIRRDIKSFYESVPRERVTEKIKNDYLLSWESKRLLDDLFQSPMLAATQGLPRGISLSATLSEIYMRRFDKTIGQMDGVLYYARYVDDIIILSFKNSESIISSIEDELRIMGLTLNAEKSPPPIELPDRSKALCSCHISCSCDQALEYLGYKISFPKQPAEWDKRRQGRFVCVSLSKRKLKRMKSRTARAFSDFCAGSSFALLTRRLQYLTSNYPLLLNKFKKGLKGGIYYHYPLLSDLSVLNELDRYLLALVFSKKGRLGKLLTKRLTDSDRTKLKKYSFVSGFKNRFFVRLTQAELSEIGKCWRYG